MCGSHQPLKQSKRVHCTTTKSPSRWCLSCLLHSTLNKCSQRCSKTCKQFSIAQNTLWGRAASSILNGHYNTSSTVSNISTSAALCVLHHALQDCNPPPPPPPDLLSPTKHWKTWGCTLKMSEVVVVLTMDTLSSTKHCLEWVNPSLARLWSNRIQNWKLTTGQMLSHFSPPIHYTVSTRNVLPSRLLRHHLMALSFCRKWTSNFVFLFVGGERVWRRVGGLHCTSTVQYWSCCWWCYQWS